MTVSCSPLAHTLSGLLALGILTAARAEAAPPPEPSFDHTAFDALLKRHVDGEGMVDYGGFREAPSFPAYLARLDAARPLQLPEAERLAYWINVYNAYTIQLIVAHKERDSIRNIDRVAGVPLKSPWSEKIVAAGGRVLHLDNVEHDIIRTEFRAYPGWQRIHAALVCAAVGCPPLRNEAYTGARLEAQLDDQARVFLLRSPAKNRVDLATSTFHASSIIADWYKADFGGTDAAVMRWAAGFFPPGKEKDLLLSGRATMKTTDYDWTLNSQEKARLRR